MAEVFITAKPRTFVACFLDISTVNSLIKPKNDENSLKAITMSVTLVKEKNYFMSHTHVL